MKAALEEVRDSAILSLESLDQTHKHARNNKHYKRAELKVIDGLSEAATCARYAEIY